MGRPVKAVTLSEAAKQTLEQGWRNGKSHCYRQRCRMVLLKAAGQRSDLIAGQVESCAVSVNSWVSRYLQQGIAGLQTKAGRGRKPILVAADEAVVRTAIGQERQRLSQAKHLIETELNKQFSLPSLKRFLKVVTAVTNESENG